jgi:hypothetical protein
MMCASLSCLDRALTAYLRTESGSRCTPSVSARSENGVELGHALEAIRRDGQSVISGGIGGDGEDGFEDEEVQEGKDGE